MAVLPPPSAESPVPHSQPHVPEDWCLPVSAIENSGRDGSTVEHQQELVIPDRVCDCYRGKSPLLSSLPIPFTDPPSLPFSPLFPFPSTDPPSLPFSPLFPFPSTNLHSQWAESLQQRLWQQGRGALLKASTQKQQSFCLDGGVLVTQGLNHFILDATKSRLGRKGRGVRGQGG